MEQIFSHQQNRRLFYFYQIIKLSFKPLINKLFSNQINKKDLLKNLSNRRLTKELY